MATNRKISKLTSIQITTFHSRIKKIQHRTIMTHSGTLLIINQSDQQESLKAAVFMKAWSKETNTMNSCMKDADLADTSKMTGTGITQDSALQVYNTDLAKRSHSTQRKKIYSRIKFKKDFGGTMKLNHNMIKMKRQIQTKNTNMTETTLSRQNTEWLSRKLKLAIQNKMRKSTTMKKKMIHLIQTQTIMALSIQIFFLIKFIKVHLKINDR